MASRTFVPHLLRALLILHQARASPQETNETPTYTSRDGPDMSITTGEENMVTINTTAETGGTFHPESSTDHTRGGPDLSFTTGENMVTINTTAEPGGTFHPETSVTEVTMYTDLTPGGETPTIAPTDTGGTFYPEPSTYTTSAAPDLSFTKEGENMVSMNTTAETGGISHPGDDSCLLDADCPPFSSCIQLDGLHRCHCDLGLFFHPDLGCVTVRTFPARIAISALRAPDGANEKRSQLGGPMSQEVADLFAEVFGHVEGYLSSAVTGLQPGEGYVTIAHFFSLLHVVTDEALHCDNGSCISLLGSDIYHRLSLCDFAFCDSASSICTSQAGLATCECRDGYYKFNPNDRSCRACDSGFWWSEGHCQSCPLGYGGFNCQEAFMLAVIVETCAGSVLLVSLITLLFYYLRRKKKPKPTFMDSLVLGGSADQPVVKLPRAQFSWTREWEWTDPSGKTPESLRQEGTVLVVL